MFTQRPVAHEYDPYFDTYIQLVPDGDLLSMLADNLTEVTQLFKQVPINLENYVYASGKWSIKELLAHLIDTERVLAYRALTGLRMDKSTMLPSFDQDLYAKNRNVSEVELKQLIQEFEIVRKSTLYLYESAKEKNIQFVVQSEAGSFTASALGYIMIGHTLHHMQVMNERYLLF